MFNFRRKNAATLEAEQSWTPLELAGHPGLWREIVKNFRPPLSQVKRYTRSDIAPGVTHYAAGRGARTLIVGFCGLLSPMLLLPTPAFLQSLDDDTYDVLTIWDQRRLHFDFGVDDFATSLEDLCRNVKTFAAAHGYTSLITYGTSMGGLPALRAGELMRADRAISIGGRFAWNINRLIGGQPAVKAFDPLCECRRPLRVKAYALFSRDQQEDAGNAAKLAALIGQNAVVDMPADRHNFLFLIHKKGQLEQYHREIFDLRREPDPGRLRAMV